ncbi:hypothetical protein [Ferruginibacter sp.]|nr:hypothetical protein [Ferruginibacter sp.]
MKKKILFFLLVYINVCFSQTTLQYANFIQTDTSVKWAAIYNSFINLTPANPNFNIRNFYFKKSQTNSIKAYSEDSLMLSVYPYELNNNAFLQNKKTVDYDNTKMNWHFNYDNKNDGFDILFKEDSNTCDNCLTKNKLSIFKVKQLLYYKNNQLKIQNILLNPIYYKKAYQNNREDVQYFETANFCI